MAIERKVSISVDMQAGQNTLAPALDQTKAKADAATSSLAKTQAAGASAASGPTVTGGGLAATVTSTTAVERRIAAAERDLQRRIATEGMTTGERRIYDLQNPRRGGEGASEAQVSRLRELDAQLQVKQAETMARTGEAAGRLGTNFNAAQSAIGRTSIALSRFIPGMGEARAAFMDLSNVAREFKRDAESGASGGGIGRAAGIIGVVGAGIAGGSLGSSFGGRLADVAPGASLGVRNTLGAFGSIAGGLGGGAGAGAAVGATVGALGGPIGALGEAAIGGAIGVVTGIFGAITSGSERARESTERLRESMIAMARASDERADRTIAAEERIDRLRRGGGATAGDLGALFSARPGTVGGGFRERLTAAPREDRMGIIRAELAEERRRSARAATGTEVDPLTGEVRRSTAADRAERAGRLAFLERAASGGIEGITRGADEGGGRVGGAETAREVLMSAALARSPAVEAAEATTAAVEALSGVVHGLLDTVRSWTGAATPRP